MGYYRFKERTPFDSVGFHSAENDYYHEYSLKEVGRRYAFNKLNELLPLKEYLELPLHTLPDMIEGLREGTFERYQWDERQKAKENNGLTQEQLLQKEIDKLNNQ